VRIEIDHAGYPTEASIEALKTWSGTLEEIPSLFDEVAAYFNDCGYGKAVRSGRCWRFATGGWSGCEEVLDSLPIMARSFWMSSHRGGLHIYRRGK